jgi:hypothetical protein
MATAKGSHVQLLLIEESTWGTTPATPTAYKIPVSGIGGDWYRRNLVDNPELRANRSPQAPVRGNVQVNGSFQHPLHLDAFGWLMKHGIGVPAVSTPSTGVYSHISKMNFSGAVAGSSLPVGLSFEIGFTDIAQYHTYSGCKINTLAFNATSEGVVICDVGIIGQDFTQDTTSGDASPTAYTSSAIDHFLGSINEGGSPIAYVTDVSMTINNNLDSSLYTVGSAGQLGDLPEGVGMVSGSLTALFQDDTLLKKGRDNTESSLMLKWTSGTSSLQLDVPELIYEPASPTVSGSAGVKVTLNYRGYYTNHGDATAIKATLINTVASY